MKQAPPWLIIRIQMDRDPPLVSGEGVILIYFFFLLKLSTKKKTNDGRTGGVGNIRLVPTHGRHSGWAASYGSGKEEHAARPPGCERETAFYDAGRDWGQGEGAEVLLHGFYMYVCVARRLCSVALYLEARMYITHKKYLKNHSWSMTI